MSMPTAPATCDRREQREILAQARALGVPRDYATRRALRRMPEPKHLVCIGTDIHDRAQWLAPAAARAWRRMHAAAAGDAIELQLVSAFRSARYQLGIVQRKLEHGQTIEQILRVSAAPGYSEHHLGHVLDLTQTGFAPLEEAFEHSPAFAWLRAHAARFGFVLSYPRGNRHGIAYEPWHWRWHPRRARRLARRARP